MQMPRQKQSRCNWMSYEFLMEPVVVNFIFDPETRYIHDSMESWRHLNLKCIEIKPGVLILVYKAVCDLKVIEEIIIHPSTIVLLEQ